ncbi:hypothetical protein [Nonomuraea jiangxiensis]|uniref:Tissue inhibitor of metalloproteinase n=1 Tax=Nonomuraea jiangxiensis TaxID=633440 RepID=A0A1G9ES66_9ACTN|nr:hypothetical protein [Nonomuraea jiangxiensis]SDK78986.1 hypothetical protein SAMN05421869_1196 [Nonomuraea jiangxiensis]
MMVRILSSLGTMAALLLISGGPAGASSGCSCAGLEPRRQLAAAAAVFSATATDVRVDEPMLNGGSLTATLRADHVYKGAVSTEFRVSAKAQEAACGYEFTKGRRYLVFAGVGDSGLTTGLCAGNRILPAGDQPLRLSDRTQGMRPLTPELITVLGEPTKVRHTAQEQPSGPGRTDPVLPAAAVVAVAGAVGGIVWARRRARAR